MKTNVVRFFMAVLSICVIINLVYQIYVKVFSPYQTEVVYEYQHSQKIEVNGFLFKNEAVLEEVSDAGVIHHLYDNGSRVAKGSSIAMVYQNESDVTAVSQINSLDKQIEFLKTAQNTSTGSDASITTLNKQLTNNYVQMMKSLESGDLSNLNDQKQNVTLILNKRQIVTKEVTDYNNVIQQLAQQKSELQSSISAEPQNISSPYSGIFVDCIDGMESQMTLDYSNSITQSELEDLLSQNPKAPSTDSSVLGKIITLPEINYVALFPTSALEEIKKGNTYTLNFEDTLNGINAEIINIEQNKNNEKSMVTFRITNLTEDIVSLRKSSATLLLGQYTGLKVSKSALRTENNETGVYVVAGANMKFRKVEILFESDQYVIVSNSGDSNSLQLYDTIITKGKDLYDGKDYK